MTLPFTHYDFWAVLTPLLLVVLALVVMILDGLFKKQARVSGWISLLGILGILAVQGLICRFLRSADAAHVSVPAFQGQYAFDFYGLFFNSLFLIAAGAAAALSLTYWRDKLEGRAEHYILLLIAATGMCLMAAAHDLLVLFIGLETMSIAIYILVGSEWSNPKSGEAAIKYLLLGAFASAILIYGMAFVYGVTGTLNYREILPGVQNIMAHKNGSELFMLLGGVSLMMAGLFFKVAAVPFHMWTPDVYEGAPAPITGFMATGVKAAAFAALVRLVITAFVPLWNENAFHVLLWVLAALTMSLGNITAVAQRNVKRMLAFSSIAHAGYLLVGVLALVTSGGLFLGNNMPNADIAGSGIGSAGVSILFYLLAYTFMNLGAFGIIVALSRYRTGYETLDDFSGLSVRKPGLAAAMAIFMLSLAGIPPLAGFAAKFYIIQSALAVNLYWLAIIMVLNSVVSAYYYLRVLVYMYMQPEQAPADRSLPVGYAAQFANTVMAAFILIIGIFPQWLLPVLALGFSAKTVYLP